MQDKAPPWLAVMQILSVLCYRQSLCPVPAPMNNEAPAVIRMLLSPAAPASRIGAAVVLLVVTVVVLFIAHIAIRRMQASYSTEA